MDTFVACGSDLVMELMSLGSTQVQFLETWFRKMSSYIPSCVGGRMPRSLASEGSPDALKARPAITDPSLRHRRVALLTPVVIFYLAVMFPG